MQTAAKDDVYRPGDTSIVLDHSSAPRLKFRERTHKEMERAVHSPDLKRLISDVAFLTDKAMRDDIVIYAGSNIGHWFPIVAKMFPTLHFLVYDGNPIKLDKMAEQIGLPPNVRVKASWFTESEAKRYVRTAGGPHQQGVLLIADSNNLEWDKENPGPVLKDIHKDLADQDTWLHALKPRSAMLKFDLPFQEAKLYSYLKGQMCLQPFAPKTSTEVKLVVDSQPCVHFSGEYPREVYDSQAHDECMFHHNSQTRLMHTNSDSKIKISWDQHASHQILERWADRALLDDQVSGISMSSMGEDGQVLNLTSKRALSDMRKKFVSERVDEIDLQFGRTLGCRMSRLLGQFVNPDNHIKRNEMGWRRIKGKWRVNRFGQPAQAGAREGSSGDDDNMIG